MRMDLNILSYSPDVTPDSVLTSAIPVYVTLSTTRAAVTFGWYLLQFKYQSVQFNRHEPSVGSHVGSYKLSIVSSATFFSCINEFIVCFVCLEIYIIELTWKKAEEYSAINIIIFFNIWFVADCWTKLKNKLKKNWIN